MFLAKGATYPGMPLQFAYPAAIGDLVTAVLALVAIFAVAGNREGGRFLVWLFNIVGTADLLLAITLATIYRAPAFMARPTGFRRSGCRHSSSATTSCLS